MRQFGKFLRRASKAGPLLLVIILFKSTSLVYSRAGRATTKQDVARMMTSLSNWGRWGKEDQLGALNLITPAKKKAAAALVHDGASVSLAHNVVKVKIFNSAPFEHHMEVGKEGAGDEYSVRYHGYSQTHMDALCHFSYEGRMYNGFSHQEVTDKGAAKLSVINVKNGIFTRGVLMDFPRLFGEKYLKGHRAITPADLEEWQKKAGFTVESGDALLINTGHWARYAAEGEWDVEKDSPGLDVSCMPWLKQHDIALLGSDLASDVMPSGVEGVVQPIHLITIVALGVPILDNCDFQALSQAAAARNRWTFLLTVDPLAVDGGTGSPVNPVAIF
jgi:kynurenine formamidase